MVHLADEAVRPWTTTAGVRTWLVDLAAAPGVVLAAERLLTDDERRRAQRGTPAVHRRRVLLRAALRIVLAEASGLAPGAVSLVPTAHGRPSPAGPGGPLLDANCSASGELGLVAIGRARRVGVDVEKVVPWSADISAEGWLSAAERAALQCLPVDERALAATRSWTQKEAVLKARGTGLLDDPCSVVTSVGRPSGVVAGWAVVDLPVPRGWVASLASGPQKKESS